jgi:ligand-binding SRPBCC domain-containing protein
MPDTYLKRTRIEAPAEEVFRWHMRPEALADLTPPWEQAEILERTGGIDEIGSRVVLRVGRWPLRMRWVAEHTAFERGRMFRDVQIEGPFALWEHTHRFEPDGPGACWLEDRVEYALPLGRVGRAVGGALVRRKLERMFEFRHRVTADAVSGQPRSRE